MGRLCRADPSLPGFTRRRAGKGFVYHDEAGKRIADIETLERIKALVIPPAWEDVWICPSPNGHLQAVGVDARGRRQYLYHERWRARRDAQKFEHMVDFARALPDMRERCSELLDGEGLTRGTTGAGLHHSPARPRVFRIGGEEYVERNKSYGLATLCKKHVTIGPEAAVTFDYPAKAGKRRVQTIADEAVFGVVAALKRRRTGGPELFVYRDGRRWAEVRSSDINDFVKELSGGEFTAKDFRTWAGTVLAAVALAVVAKADSKTARKRAISRAYQEVAHYLGNTPAVCRKSYIDPRVVDRYRAGVTIAKALGRFDDTGDTTSPAIHGAVEDAVLELLEDAPDAAVEAA